ncbi:DEAD/DEAH box helicase [Glutamicibacter ardleyensis]|uniref:DEAD/DEAH box helicase n=1 Tax=Glutamicibacter ardleyensis TaxID=225894 RepID=UPI003FD18EEC
MREGYEGVKQQLQDFPTRFLLFAKHVELLELEIHGQDGELLSYSHTCREDPERENVYRVSRPDGSNEEWYLNEATHRPSEKAKQQIGLATVRDEIKIAYAAPIKLSQVGKIGSFWAYYPLDEETSASGIFNAPWALSEDRSTLLRTTYNDEILHALAKIFLATIVVMRTKENPSQHLMYLPSRDLETKGYSDSRLTSLIPSLAANIALIPDQDGLLRHASELSHLSFSSEFFSWQSAKNAPLWHQKWQENLKQDILVPHYTAYGDLQKFPRLRQLFLEGYYTASYDLEGGSTTRKVRPDFSIIPSVPLNQWMEMLVKDETDYNGMAVALQLLEMIPEATAQKSGLSAKIVPTNLGLASPAQGSSVFLPISDEEEVDLPGVQLVLPLFLEFDSVPTSLKYFGFSEVNPGDFSKHLFKALNSASMDSEWLRAWDSLLNVGSSHWHPLLRKIFEEQQIKVLTLSGKWRAARECFVITTGSPSVQFRDPSLVVDQKVCPPELAKLAGSMSNPTTHFDVRNEAFFDSYREWARIELRRAYPALPVNELVEADFVESLGPGPISLFTEFADEGYERSASEWSIALLKLTNPTTRYWEIMAGESHSLKVLAPHLWAVKQYGYLQTTLGLLKSSQSLGPRAMEYGAYFPVATDPATRDLYLPDSLASVTFPQWTDFFASDRMYILRATKAQREFSKVALFGVRALLEKGVTPKNVPAISKGEVQKRRVDEVQLVVGDEELEQILDLAVPYLITESEQIRDEFCDKANFKNAASSISISTERIPSTVDELIVDRFPTLVRYLDDAQQQISLQYCSVLSRRINSFGGVKEEQLESDFFGSTVYLIDGIGEEETLARVIVHLNLGLSANERNSVLREVEDQRIALLREQCRVAPDDATRINLLADVHTLEATLPQGLKPSLLAFGVTIDATNIAQVFLDTYGFGALATLKRELEILGLNPPISWAGSSSTVRFVQSLGFDRAFAGESTNTPPATESVLGRPGLHPLHDYQEAAFLKIREVLTSPLGSAKKGMVELPTGAGKTRVAVESAVRLFLSRELSGPILWIAESDELCNQAAETWSEVWREFADSRTLTIARFWGARQIERPSTELSVIIATDAKLRQNLPLGSADVPDTYEYSWLDEATAIIVDEGHRATSSTFGAIFRFFGTNKVQDKAKRPLLGLSATPFKGRSADLTSQLASRFGVNLITTLGPEPIKELQNRGVLAQVEHEFLEGTTIDLSDVEMFRPDSNLINNKAFELVKEKVNSDGARTKRLIDHILSRPTDESILVFTSTVLNAQVISALLKNQGLSAAAISGETKPNLRRALIDQFKAGSIQVLVNCDVLLQGFDAPKVRTLYVARPTFSPSRYIQMVGRGLRGPKNGGTDRCLIVDLKDELLGTTHNLAYRDFTAHWKGE